MQQSNILSYKSLPTINKVIDIITKKEKGAYLRFGDGDLNIMQGMNELLNSYNEKFSNELKDSMKIDNENYLKGVCLMCNKFGLLEEKMWPGNHEWPENIATHYYNFLSFIRKKPLLTYYTFVAFNYYLTTYPEKSYPLMKKIRDLCLKNDVIFIGNNTVNKNVINLFFGQEYTFIECPSKNSYNTIDNIENQLMDTLNNNINYKIVITCCGVTSRCLIKRIWKKQNIICNYFMLDFGSIIDALSGNKTRQYIIDTKFDGEKYCEGFKKYISNE